MNEFLKTRKAVDDASKYLEENNLISSGLSCKNWEIFQVIPFLKDGNICDLGSDGSVVLPNAVNLKLKGWKVGIDLAYEENANTDYGIDIFKGDLMATMFDDEAFDIVTCLSVIEHSVKYDKIAKEVSRILKIGGSAFISFDYWETPLDTSLTKLYSLDWNVLCKENVVELVHEFKNNAMELTTEIDWTIQDAVINSTFCSPQIGIEYTFGILNFIKK